MTSLSKVEERSLLRARALSLAGNPTADYEARAL